MSEVTRISATNVSQAHDPLFQLSYAQGKIAYYATLDRDAPAAWNYAVKSVNTIRSRGGVNRLSENRIGFFYAHGFGVPRDTEKARSIFNVNGKQSVLAQLMDIGKLPTTPEDVTPAHLEKLRKEEQDAKTQAFLLMAITILSQSPQRRAPASQSGPSMSECMFAGGGGLGAIVGCYPR
jgi:hypothetical protein